MFELIENILQEADKSRFLKPLWDQFSANSEPIKQFNITYEDLLNFINKDDPLIKKYFDIYGISWQSAGNDGSRWVSITQAYLERLKIQKNKEREKAVWGKDNIIDMATAVGLRVCEQGTDVDDSYDFVHLKDLDNDTFTFLAPMSYDACVFCDSVQAGGEGAKWCLGYEKTNGYWNDYIEAGNLFIFAFNNKAFKKGKNRESNTLKYMIQLNENPDETRAWLQDDNPDDCVSIHRLKRVFGRSACDLAVSFSSSILCDDNVYSREQTYGFWSVEDGEPQIPWDDDDLVDRLFDIDDFYSGCFDIDDESNGENNLKLIYDKKGEFGLCIDCHSKELIPSKMHIKELEDSDSLDIPKLCDWIKRYKSLCSKFTQLYIKFGYILIKNAKISSIIWEPEASDFKCDIYFENCDIIDLYQYDFSDGENTIDIDAACAVKAIHWPVSENQFSMSEPYFKSLKIAASVYSYASDEYEEDDEEE